MINPREVVTLIRVKFGLMIKEGATLILSCLNFIIDNSDLFPASRRELPLALEIGQRWDHLAFERDFSSSMS